MATARKSTSKPRKRPPARETPKPRPIKLRPDLPRAQAHDVTLVRLPGTEGKGKNPGGERWRIDVAGVRAGEVYINVIDEPPLGHHASLQIYLNLKHQGRGIGRIGYAKACEASQHETIYAHVRKSNTASRRAAAAAGFVDATPAGVSQLILKWQRTAQATE